jgi:hypothetical protein
MESIGFGDCVVNEAVSTRAVTWETAGNVLPLILGSDGLRVLKSAARCGPALQMLSITCSFSLKSRNLVSSVDLYQTSNNIYAYSDSQKYMCTSSFKETNLLNESEPQGPLEVMLCPLQCLHRNDAESVTLSIIKIWLDLEAKFLSRLRSQWIWKR